MKDFIDLADFSSEEIWSFLNRCWRFVKSASSLIAIAVGSDEGSAIGSKSTQSAKPTASCDIHAGNSDAPMYRSAKKYNIFIKKMVHKLGKKPKRTKSNQSPKQTKQIKIKTNNHRARKLLFRCKNDNFYVPHGKWRGKIAVIVEIPARDTSFSVGDALGSCEKSDVEEESVRNYL